MNVFHWLHLEEQRISDLSKGWNSIELNMQRNSAVREAKKSNSRRGKSDRTKIDFDKLKMRCVPQKATKLVSSYLSESEYKEWSETSE